MKGVLNDWTNSLIIGIIVVVLAACFFRKKKKSVFFTVLIGIGALLMIAGIVLLILIGADIISWPLK